MGANKPINNGGEYLCSKCGAKVGYYVITGHGEDEWNYKKDKFCSRCGQPVEWETAHSQKRLVGYSCGHMYIEIGCVYCYDEEYGTKYKEKSYGMCLHECPICMLKKKTDESKVKYERLLKQYQFESTHYNKNTDYLTEIPEEFKNIDGISDFIKP